MPFKPLPIKTFEKFIEAVGGSLEKGAVDWNLYNEKSDFICSVMRRFHVA